MFAKIDVKALLQSKIARVIMILVAIILLAALALRILQGPKSGQKQAESASTAASSALPSSSPSSAPSSSSAASSEADPQHQGLKNPLTGVYDLPAEASGKRPYAVMVSNIKQSRPQWGIASPDIWIETLVEGGITRLMVLYADGGSIPQLGPIRSARHDYVELAEGFDALYVHFGASDIAQNVIAQDGVDDLDGNYSQKYFNKDTQRANSVGIEHSFYSDGELMEQGITAKDLRTEIKPAYAAPFKFNDQERPRDLDGGAGTKASVYFSGLFISNFEYDAATKTYLKFIGDTPHLDAVTGQQIASTNVIVLFADIVDTGDASHHQDVKLTQGSGVCLSNGTQSAIHWQKGVATDPLELTLADGSPLALNAGKSYICIAPTSYQNKFSAS